MEDLFSVSLILEYAKRVFQKNSGIAGNELIFTSIC